MRATRRVLKDTLEKIALRNEQLRTLQRKDGKSFHHLPRQFAVCCEVLGCCYKIVANAQL